jgi:hypothetical protein
MIVTTIGRVRERDPDATFVLLIYFPERDRAPVRDPGVTLVDARPRRPAAALQSLARDLHRCRAAST